MITETTIWLGDRSKGLTTLENVICIDGLEGRAAFLVARDPLLLAGLIDIDVTFLSR